MVDVTDIIKQSRLLPPLQKLQAPVWTVYASSREFGKKAKFFPWHSLLA